MSSASLSPSKRQAVAKRSHYRCSYCQTQEEIVGVQFTIDFFRLCDVLNVDPIYFHPDDAKIEATPTDPTIRFRTVNRSLPSASHSTLRSSRRACLALKRSWD